MLVIRLQKTGRRNAPTFRIVVAEKSAPIQGRFTEIVGHYLPKRQPHVLEFKEERIAHWIQNGAKPTDTVARLLSQGGMSGLETYIKAYTKQKKRNPSEEDIAKEEAATATAPEEKPAEEASNTPAETDTAAETETEPEKEEAQSEPEETSDEEATTKESAAEPEEPADDTDKKPE